MMVRLKLLTAIIVILTLTLGCCFDSTAGRLPGILGIERDDFEIEEENDTHGGFHGDGETFIILSIPQDSAVAVDASISENSDWKALPLTENLKNRIYGTDYYSPLAGNFFPDVSNGFYYFYDRHRQADDPHDDTETFSGRFSYNLTLAIYDTDIRKIYYYELDT